jgi:hypothetical protein
MYTNISLDKTEVEVRRKALSKAVECKIKEVEHTDGAEFKAEGAEYLVLTDKEAEGEMIEYVRESAWAFNASFILSECGLDYSGIDSLKSMQEKSCESANDFILSLIKKTCGLESFASAAEGADGRGHFLSSYDGEELESGGYFIYRTN